MYPLLEDVELILLCNLLWSFSQVAISKSGTPSSFLSFSHPIWPVLVTSPRLLRSRFPNGSVKCPQSRRTKRWGRERARKKKKKFFAPFFSISFDEFPSSPLPPLWKMKDRVMSVQWHVHHQNTRTCGYPLPPLNRKKENHPLHALTNQHSVPRNNPAPPRNGFLCVIISILPPPPLNLFLFFFSCSVISFKTPSFFFIYL